METTPIQPQIQSVYKLSKFGILFKTSWNRYVTNLKLFLPILLISGIVTILTSLATPAPQPSGAPAAELGAGLRALFLFLFILQIIIQSVSQIALREAALNQTVTLGLAFKKGLQFLVSYWWLTFIASAIILAGFFALIIPGIILSVSFSIMTFVLLNENIRSFAALQKSRAYVKGYGWSVFSLLFIFGILTALMAIILTWIIKGVLGDFKATSEIVSIIVLFTATPLITIATAQIYQELKAIKEKQPTPKSLSVGTLKWLTVLGIIGVFALAAAIPLFIAKISSNPRFQKYLSDPAIQEQLNKTLNTLQNSAN